MLVKLTDDNQAFVEAYAETFGGMPDDAANEAVARMAIAEGWRRRSDIDADDGGDSATC